MGLVEHWPLNDSLSEVKQETEEQLQGVTGAANVQLMDKSGPN